MKKFFLAVAMLFIIGGATTASAQFKFGIVAGMNMSKLSFDDGKYFNSEHRAGWYVGPKVWFSIPVVGLGINASAQYSQRRLNVQSDEDGSMSDSKNLNTIEIPINVRYTLGLGSIASVYAETGPQFGFNVGSMSESTTYEDNDYGTDTNSKGSIFGFNVAAITGIDVYLTQNLYLGAELGLGYQMNKVTPNKTTTTGPDTTTDNSFQASSYFGFLCEPTFRLGWTF